MPDQTEWKYVVAPGFVGRFGPGTFELCSIDDDTWKPCHDLEVWNRAELDGRIVTKEKALASHAVLKKRSMP